MNQLMRGASAALALALLVAGCGNSNGDTTTANPTTTSTTTAAAASPTPAEPTPLRDAADGFVRDVENADTVEQYHDALRRWAMPGCAEMMIGVSSAFIGTSGPMPDDEPMVVLDVAQDGRSGTTTITREGGESIYHWSFTPDGWRFDCQGLLDFD